MFLPWSSPLARRLPPVGFQTCTSPPYVNLDPPPLPIALSSTPDGNFKRLSPQAIRYGCQASFLPKEEKVRVGSTGCVLTFPLPLGVSLHLSLRGSRGLTMLTLPASCLLQPPRPRLVPRGSTPSESEEVTSSTEPSDSTLETSLGDPSTLPRRSESSVLCVSLSVPW